MKVFVLLCLVGFALASSPLGSEWRWKSGYEYVFKYQGRLLTGLPELATHYSGVGLKADIHLTVESSTKFGMKIRDPYYVRVNDELNSGSRGQESSNWRNVELPSLSPVSSEYARYLSMETMFEFSESTGEFRYMRVSEEEPEWSINFKKALIAIFQTKMEESTSAAIDENRIESSESTETFWKVKEQSIDGLCEVMYQINELPEYMIKDLPELVSESGVCRESESRFYELTKTKDVSSCEKRATFSYYKPGHFKCPTGNCDGMWSRSSVTRYIACGSSRDNLQIQTIINEGELQQEMMGVNAEKFLTGTKQVLKLVKFHPVNRSVDCPSDFKTLRTLYYVYKYKNVIIDGSYSEEQQSILSEEEEESYGSHGSRRWSSIYHSLPRNILTRGSVEGEEEQEEYEMRGSGPSSLIPQMKKLMSEMIRTDLFADEHVAERQIPMKVLSIARGFTMLDIKSVETLYTEMKSEFSASGSETESHTFRNVFFDCLVMGGSVHNMEFLKKKMLSGEIPDLQSSSLFMSLPHYIVAPTNHLMDSLYDLVTSTHVRSRPMVHNHAIMSYSILIERACIAENRKTSYPTFIYGEFCHPESEVVVNKWIPYLSNKIRESNSKSERNLAIVALGMMSHKNVIPILLPIVEGREESRSLTRFLAVYSLSNVGRRNPNLVVPVAFAIFNNQAECTEIRVAAFNLLMKMNPSMTIFHKIAASTWNERDTELLNVVNTAFYSLSHQMELEPMKTTTISLQRKAWLVYPLIKKTAGRYPTSGTIYSSDYMKYLGVGYHSELTWTASKDSILPSEFYNKLVYIMDRYQFSPLEFGMRFRGVETIVEELIKLITHQSSSTRSGTEPGKIPEKIKETLSHEWKEVIEKLRIKSRESNGVEALFWANIMENAPIFHSFETSSSELIREKIEKYMRNPSELKEKLSGEGEVNFQRLFDLSPFEFLIPSDMGLPIVVEVHMPVTFSVRGSMTSEANRRQPSVNMKVRAQYAAQFTGWVGTICPFSRDYVVTGIDEHSVMSIPAEFNVRLNVPEQKFSLSIKPDTSRRSGFIDVFHYRVRPFCVYTKFNDLVPMTLSSNMKVIRSSSPLKNIERSFGEEYLGLKLNSIVRTESRYVDFRSCIERMKLFNYNPLNMLRFSWAPTALSERETPSFRQHAYKLQFDPSNSITKELEIEVRLGVCTKKVGESPKYHTIEPKEQGEEYESSSTESTLKKLLPYKISSKKLSEESRHPRRQERIKKVMDRIEVESGSGFSLITSLILKGSRQRTFSYSLNAASGQSGLKQKWDLHLESEHNPEEKICVYGDLDMPSLPIFKIEELRHSLISYRFQNVIGYGRDCKDSTVKVTGSTKVSESQKKYSQESPEAKAYEKLIEKNAPLAQLSEVAEKVRRQASGLDEVDYTVRFVNVPRWVMKLNERTIEYLKAFYWPYVRTNNMNVVPRNMETSSMTERVRMLIHPRSQTFDLTISRPDDTVSFEGIRIPYPFTYFMPASALKSPLTLISESLVGKSIYPVCKIEGGWLKTYDNTSTTIKEMDECYHLLSGDCSELKRFGVLVRNLESGSSESTKELKVLLGKKVITMMPTERHSRYSSSIEVKVGGERFSLSEHSLPKIVHDSEGRQIASIRKARDGAISMDSTWVSLQFDGYKAKVEVSRLLKNKLCGLCGSLNGQKKADLNGPRKCIYSKPEIFLASYRVEGIAGATCRSLPSSVESKLRRENEECAKYKEIPTKVVRSFEAQSGKCTRHEHEIIEKSTELCFSRKPVIECGPMCKPESIREKRVTYTCLPKSRMARHYAEKVRSGKVLPELESMPESFSVKVALPRTCNPVNH